MSEYYLGLDIGGTKVEAALLSTDDKFSPVQKLTYNNQAYYITFRQRIATNRDQGYSSILDRIQTLVIDLCKQAGIEIHDLTGMGVGAPGSVDPKTNVILHANSAAFNGRNLAADLKQKLKLGFEVYCDNDANLFALAETFLGAGLKLTTPSEITSIGVILGTGCGGGIIQNGLILQGARGGGGEIGHTMLKHDGDKCYCGRIGCAELYLSGTGIQNSYEQLSSKEASAVEIFKRSKAKDKEAQTVIQNYQHDLANFLANLTNIIDPDMIVLGGGVSSQDLIYQALEEKVQKLAFIPNHPVKILKNELGDSAGVLGAALLPLL